MTASRFATRVAVVTGGTGALGREVAYAFARDGATVHVPWVVEAEVDDARRRWGDLAESIHPAEADVADEDGVRGFFAAVERQSGPPHILANVAGGFAYAPLDETTLATWNRMVSMNAQTMFLSCRAVVSAMKAAGRGRIINVGAVPALEGGAAGMTAYTAAKAAVLSFTRSLAREVAGTGVTVNAIVPSIIDTPANRDAMPDADRGTWLPPAEIAGVIAFLASDDARIVNGAAIRLSLG